MRHASFSAQTFRWLFLGLILLITVLVYWKGLSGPFVLDDMPNLTALARLSLPLDWGQIINYLLDDIGHRGRVVSRASFLLHVSDWPNNPEAFKKINLLLHLCNGVLLAGAFALILRHMQSALQPRLQVISLAVAALWLLHPLNVSTVLYAVQRMTILAGMFTLLGLALYLWGRQLAASRQRTGYILMTLAIGFGTLLGTLSKENGILLPAFVLITELTLLQNWQRPNRWRWWAVIVLGTPIAFVVLWHLINYSTILAGYGPRSFSIQERLLTEPRILFQYLYYIFIPQRLGTGLFHDDIAISTDLLRPYTTAFSLLGFAGLWCFALALRKRLPVLAFAILWFFAGHVLESGVIALEMYFEHRNYIPMIGPLFAVCYYTLYVLPAAFRYVGGALLIAIIATSAFNTYQNTQVWSSATNMAVTWELEHPNSQRALQFSASAWLKAGHIPEARQRLEKLLTINPKNTGAASQMVLLACLDAKQSALEQLTLQSTKLSTLPLDFAALPTLQQILKLIKKGECAELRSQTMLDAVNKMLAEQPKHGNRNKLAQLHFLKAEIHQMQRENAQAARALRRSFDLAPNFRTAILESVEWSKIGEFDDAIRAVNKAIARQRKKAGYFYVTPPDLIQWKMHLIDLSEGRNNPPTQTLPTN